MRRLTVFVIILLIAVTAYAEEWYTATQHTVSWDAGDGAASYNVFIKPRSGGALVPVGTTAATQYTVTLPGVGRWFICAQSVAGEDTSEISCSDVAADCLNGLTFGLKVNPGNPKNLR